MEAELSMLKAKHNGMEVKLYMPQAEQGEGLQHSFVRLDERFEAKQNEMEAKLCMLAAVHNGDWQQLHTWLDV
eukprot:9495370-Alexandrium_andersonii.AAC.1